MPSSRRSFFKQLGAAVAGAAVARLPSMAEAAPDAATFDSPFLSAADVEKAWDQIRRNDPDFAHLTDEQIRERQRLAKQSLDAARREDLNTRLDDLKPWIGDDDA